MGGGGGGGGGKKGQTTCLGKIFSKGGSLALSPGIVGGGGGGGGGGRKASQSMQCMSREDVW